MIDMLSKYFGYIFDAIKIYNTKIFATYFIISTTVPI